MSRTNRSRHYWNWLDNSSDPLTNYDKTRIGLWNAGYKTDFNDPKHCQIDPRSAFRNGRDGKPCSVLYEDYVKQRGWCRDFYNGIQYRRDAKKRNRRWQRRSARRYIEQEVWE